jgi:serine/threonine protein kinase
MGLVPGYRWLYEVAKILHRDISLNNLMLRKENGIAYAVLNDFDLSVSADVKASSSKHRTGTKPFMAIDLLRGDPTTHLYRHDLESLFYVLVWISSRYHDGEEIVDPPLQHWAETDGLDLVDKKVAFITTLPFHPTERFESCRPCVYSMRKVFLDGIMAGTDAKFFSRSHLDNDTLGGLVTFDSFQNSFDNGSPT